MKSNSLSFLILFFAVNTLFSQTDSNPKRNLQTYYNLGVADISLNWVIDDYTDACEIILEAHKGDGIELPSKADETFQLLQKITDYENYMMMSDIDSNLMVQIKMTYINDLNGALTPLMFAYINACSMDEIPLKYSTEMLLCLKTLNYTMSQSCDIISSLDLSNLSEERKKSLEQFQYGLNLSISGSLRTISKEYNAYLESDICSFYKVFIKSYENNKHILIEADQKKYDRKIARIKKNHEFDCIREQ